MLQQARFRKVLKDQLPKSAGFGIAFATEDTEEFFIGQGMGVPLRPLRKDDEVLRVDQRDELPTFGQERVLYVVLHDESQGGHRSLYVYQDHSYMLVGTSNVTSGGLVGTKTVDESSLGDARVLIYDGRKDILRYADLPIPGAEGSYFTIEQRVGESECKLEEIESSMRLKVGQVRFGSQYIEGDFELIAGNNVTIDIDPNTNRITISAGIYGNGNPPGAVMYFARITPPEGWLECNGQAVSKTTYPLLFDAIGITFGSDGDTFRLPDLRGEFIRGWDHGRGADFNRAFGSFQADEIRAQRIPVSVGEQEALAPNGAETRPRNVALLPCIKY